MLTDVVLMSIKTADCIIVSLLRQKYEEMNEKHPPRVKYC